MTHVRDYPISLGQQQLWYHQRRFPRDSSYNISWAIRIADEFDPLHARTVVSKLVRRYPLMRAVYPEQSGKPVCHIQPANFMSWEMVQVPEDREIQVQEDVRAWHKIPFSLDNEPLVRFRLYAVGDDFILAVCMHHIISDGVSIWNMMESFGMLYQTRTLADTQVDIGYFDHIVKENEFLKTSEATARLHHYIDLVKNSTQPAGQASHNLPAETSSSRTGYHYFPCDSTLTQKLRDIARAEKVSLYTVLLASYGIFLMRSNGGQSGSLTAIAVSGRNRREMKSFGFFSDLALIRHRVSANDSFAAAIKDIAEQLHYVKNNHYPFSSLVDYLHHHHPELANSFVHSSFVCQRPPKDHAILEFSDETMDEPRYWHGLRLKPCFALSQEVVFDFGVEVAERENDLWLVFKFKYGHFDKSAIERMSARFVTLLSNLVEQPHVKVEDIGLLPESERAAVADYGAARIEYEHGHNLVDIISDISRKFPDRVAVSYGNSGLTYQELDRRSSQLAHLLLEIGVKPRQRVQLLLKRSQYMIVAILAVLKTGAAYVPTDPDAPASRIGFITEDADVAAVLTEHSLSGEVTAERPVVVVDSQETLQAMAIQDHERPSLMVRPEDAAYVIYTSGSTGTPKGVLVSHFNVARLFRSTECWFDFDETDVWSLFHSFAFDFSVWEIFGALLYGGRIAIVPYAVSRDARSFLGFLKEQGVTVLNQTPTAFSQLIAADLQSPSKADYKLRYVIFGGEALNLKSLSPWVSRYGDSKPLLVNMYGITETTVHVTYRVITKDDIETSSASLIGRAIPDLGIRIVDPSSGAPVGIGMPGEIWVSGCGVSQGYLNRPELTAQRFLAGENGEVYYRSGDLAYWLPDGDIAYLGRIDNQVKIRGFRIELGEIESLLCEHPSAEAACVLVIEEESQKRLLACIASPEDPMKLKEELMSLSRERLPHYMCPSAWLVVASMPLNINGKVDRNNLLAAYRQQNRLLKQEMDHGNPMEQVLANIWRRVLNIPEVNIHQNFFEIGGDSLSIGQIYNVIVAEGLCTAEQLSITDLFNHPTIAQCAEMLHAKTGATHIVNTVGGHGRRLHHRETSQRRVRPAQRLEH